MSATESVPSRVPAVVGVKVTLIVQLAPDVKVEPQLLVSAKLVLIVILAMLSVAPPLLLKVTYWGNRLVLPTSSLPKFKLVGDKVALALRPEAAAASPVTVCVLAVLVLAVGAATFGAEVVLWPGMR